MQPIKRTSQTPTRIRKRNKLSKFIWTSTKVLFIEEFMLVTFGQWAKGSREHPNDEDTRFCGAVVYWLSLLHNFIHKVWTQVLRRFKSCSRRVGDSRWWWSQTMVPARNKAKSLSSVNHTTKKIHHHHHHHHHHHPNYNWEHQTRHENHTPSNTVLYICRDMRNIRRRNFKVRIKALILLVTVLTIEVM